MNKDFTLPPAGSVIRDGQQIAYLVLRYEAHEGLVANLTTGIVCHYTRLIKPLTLMLSPEGDA